MPSDEQAARRERQLRLMEVLIRLGDIFSFSGASGGPDEPGETISEAPAADVVGIQTEGGQNIQTEGGTVIQAENQ